MAAEATRSHGKEVVQNVAKGLDLEAKAEKREACE